MVGSASERKTSVQLKGDRELVIERTFRAPARIVFEAYTNPELVRRWWAPKSMGSEMDEDEERGQSNEEGEQERDILMHGFE